MDISVTVCLCVYTVTDFFADDTASDVKFCTAVHRRPRHGISHFGELCSSRSPKSDESACSCAGRFVRWDATFVNIARHVDVGSACVDIRRSPKTDALVNLNHYRIRISKHQHCSQLSSDELNTAQYQATHNLLLNIAICVYVHNLQWRRSIGVLGVRTPP